MVHVEWRIGLCRREYVAVAGRIGTAAGKGGRGSATLCLLLLKEAHPSKVHLAQPGRTGGRQGILLVLRAFAANGCIGSTCHDGYREMLRTAVVRRTACKRIGMERRPSCNGDVCRIGVLARKIRLTNARRWRQRRKERV